MSVPSFEHVSFGCYLPIAGEARQSEGVEGYDKVNTVQRFLLHIS
jgi:hypothetical protein